MSRLSQSYSSEGFFGIGIFHPEKEQNIGTLWRSAYIMGASFIFLIGRKYKKESSDVIQTWRKIPLFVHETFDAFYHSLPYSTKLIGVEMSEHAEALSSFTHPNQAVYLLGAESSGLPNSVLDRCHSLIKLPGDFSLNVASAGSIVIYDRVTKIPTTLPVRV